MSRNCHRFYSQTVGVATDRFISQKPPFRRGQHPHATAGDSRSGGLCRMPFTLAPAGGFVRTTAGRLRINGSPNRRTPEESLRKANLVLVWQASRLQSSYLPSGNAPLTAPFLACCVIVRPHSHKNPDPTQRHRENESQLICNDKKTSTCTFDHLFIAMGDRGSIGQSRQAV
ncbi:hypothetical protein RMSM_01013 [Rhodopirellula maiorica SM1]|uniref:Uncharacterized protein n=1 Tax=Rhodopirellula maiorica SM1 TaxID=1265738 RepID=M5S787_9BACT|nr:hypothetical protein RMSM_01013 [Rhodopirellula maiorica SM1]